MGIKSNHIKTKNGITKKILEILKGGATLTLGILEVYASLYVDLYPTLKRKIDRKKSWIERMDRINSWKEKQKIHNTLSRLKKNGYIQRDEKTNLWNLTLKGSNKIDNDKKYELKLYNKAKGDRLLIIAFDIPESYRRYRDWLRETLKINDYEMIQKSIFVGKSKIIRELMDDLKDRELLNFVDIFEVGKSGTLKSRNIKSVKE